MSYLALVSVLNVHLCINSIEKCGSVVVKVKESEIFLNGVKHQSEKIINKFSGKKINVFESYVRTHPLATQDSINHMCLCACDFS